MTKMNWKKGILWVIGALVLITLLNSIYTYYEENISDKAVPIESLGAGAAGAGGGTYGPPDTESVVAPNQNRPIDLPNKFDTTAKTYGTSFRPGISHGMPVIKIKIPLGKKS